LNDNAELAEQVRAELTRQLDAIVEAVPRDKVALLRKSEIWVEHFHPKFPCACYHPDIRWLKANGFNPDKLDSVDISNPRNFVDWCQQQPCMMLHELAHGLHDQVLGHDHAGIRLAYERAQESGKYEQVKHIDGSTVRHDALNNDQEYFAETTEAYFGKNDFHPFTRDELKEFDPDGYALMREIWE
jgi:tRNA U38,U39,U40 pseudouridine synthase TruA